MQDREYVDVSMEKNMRFEAGRKMWNIGNFGKVFKL